MFRGEFYIFGIGVEWPLDYGFGSSICDFSRATRIFINFMLYYVFRVTDINNCTTNKLRLSMYLEPLIRVLAIIYIYWWYIVYTV